MKQLICEMCGSNELLKQNDRYVCQMCGTNYTTEEARKLLIEVTGAVDVSGSTVKVDNSSFVQKSLENARRAKEKEDWEECEKYYNMVEQHEPTNIEAIFYSSYGKAKMAMVESDRFKREQKLNVLKKSISVIDDNYDNSPEKYEKNRKLIEQINADLMKLVNGSFVYKQTTSNNVVTNDSAYTYAMFIDLCVGWVESLKNIVNVIANKSETLYIWKIIRSNYLYIYNVINKYRVYVKNTSKAMLAEYEEKLNQTNEIIRRLDPNDNPPVIEKKKKRLF